MPEREEENGHRPQPGDEHSLQVLVILPQRKFQQKNVLGVPEACLGGRVLRIQVGMDIYQNFGRIFPVADMVSSVCSDFTVTALRRNSGRTSTGTSRLRHSEIASRDNCMDWRSSGHS